MILLILIQRNQFIGSLCMNSISAFPKIYHITPIDNLSNILECGCIWSNAERIQQKLDNTNVGITEIKQRRLQELDVSCNKNTKVGDYVPFYFCPRSIMLYLIYRGNHPDLTYHNGQEPIIHLEADMRTVVDWAASHSKPWAFSDANAGARYAAFYNTVDSLNHLNWDAIESTDFRDAVIKDGKQAEFLLYESFPCNLISRIGVINETIAQQVNIILAATGFDIEVSVLRKWYF
jgi:hypothetical protein